MRVLLLSTSFPRWTGDWAGSFVLQLAKHLADNQDVSVLTPNYPDGNSDESFGKVEVTRFNYAVPAATQKVIYPDGIPDQLKKSHLARLQLPGFVLRFLIETIRRSSRADVLLCNWVVTGVIARVASAITGKPYIVVIRGSDMKSIEKGGVSAGIYLGALKRAAAVCTVAEDFVQPLRDLGVENVHFTPNGIDLDEFTPADTSSTEGKKTIIFVGSLIERKGLKHLIEALEGLDAKLLVIGEGHLLDDMRKLAVDKNVDTEFTGIVPTEDMPGYYSKADIFVLPSLYEGRPNVLIEALACGMPCVATKIKGSSELIDDGASGLLVEPGDSSDLAEKLEMLINDGNKMQALAKSARKYLQTVVPSWNECAANYDKILQKIMGSAV